MLHYLYLTFCLCLSFCCGAQLPLLHIHQSHTITFDQSHDGVCNGTFNGNGFSSSPEYGQLDTDAWAITGLSDGNLPFGGENSSGDYARGTSSGGVTTGGVYAFETATGNFSLGIQPTTADFTPGTITLKVHNQTGYTLSGIDFSFKCRFLNNANYSTIISCSWSIDNVQFNPIDSLDIFTPAGAASNPLWQEIEKSAHLHNLSVPVNGFFYLQWHSTDNGGSGSRDEWSVDDISFLPYGQPAEPGDIIITEIMYDPSGPEPASEWFEIYNTTFQPIDLTGWQFADEGGSFFVEESAGLQINPGSYLIFARSTMACSPPDYIYPSVTLNNNGDELQIRQGLKLIDILNYHQDFPQVNPGESIQLDDETNQSDSSNDLGSNWCASRSSCGNGDFGTPNTPNDNCCYFSGVELKQFCSDNYSDNINSDDEYYITLSPDGEGFGSHYSIGGDVWDAGQSYQSESDLFGPFSINQPLILYLTDNQDYTCTYDLFITPPPHCSYLNPNLFLPSQFINPCGNDGNNELAIIYNSQTLSLADLAIGAARNLSDLTYVWLGNNYQGSPTSIPYYAGNESCQPGLLFCYNWLYPSNNSNNQVINNYIQHLNTIAGCPVFLPLPTTDSIPGGNHIAVFFAGANCLPDAPSQNLNFSNHCSGNIPIRQYYAVLGTGSPCGPAGYFENNGPRISILSDRVNLSSRSFFFSNSGEPAIITPTSQQEGPPNPCVPQFEELLPVKWITFDLHTMEQSILIQWQALTSEKEGTFQVMKSQDGNHFETISMVRKKSNTTYPVHYSSTDYHPRPGNNYYRIDFQDADGTITTSPVQAVFFDKNKTWEVTFNNETGIAHFVCHNLNNPPIKALIVHVSGRVIKEIPLYAADPNLRVSLHHLASGLYFILLPQAVYKFVITQ